MKQSSIRISGEVIRKLNTLDAELLRALGPNHAPVTDSDIIEYALDELLNRLESESS